MQKNLVIIIILALFYTKSSKCPFYNDAGMFACRYGPSTYARNIDWIRLNNRSKTAVGWFRVYNTQSYPVLLQNFANPAGKYVLAPHEAKSFNWRGKRAIRCFKPVHNSLDEHTAFMEVPCSLVVHITDCVPYGGNTGQGNRYTNLQLE